jgi:hypothetical protein
MTDEAQNNVPAGFEEITIVVDPSPEMIGRYEEWEADQLASFKAAGVTILSVDGGTFHGYYDPDTVDPDILPS